MKLRYLTKLIIIIMLTVLIASGSVAASDNLVLSVTEARGNAGDTVEVSVMIDNAAETEGGQFILNYDHELLKPVAMVSEDFLDSASDSLDMGNLDYAPGQLMFMWVTAAADTDNSGTLITVTFELLKEGESLLEIDEVVISPEGIEVTPELGMITVAGNGVAEPESEPGIEEDIDEADSDQAAEIEEPVDVEGGTSLVLIVIALIVVLAAAAFVYFRVINKPGAKHAKKKK